MSKCMNCNHNTCSDIAEPCASCPVATSKGLMFTKFSPQELGCNSIIDDLRGKTPLQLAGNMFAALLVVGFGWALLSLVICIGGAR